MFARALRINEDPATASASGPLGCCLVHHKMVPIKPTTHIINQQGIEMGRPGTRHIEMGSEMDDIPSTLPSRSTSASPWSRSVH